jgi:hypothetical protein
MKRFVLLFALSFLGATFAPAQGPQLKSSDAKKLNKAVGEWVNSDIADEANDRLSARDSIQKVLEGFVKKYKGNAIFSYLSDWGVALEYRNGKFPKAKAGKINKTTLPNKFELVYWVPSSYKPKKGAVPMVLFFGDGNGVSEEQLSALPAEIAANFVVAGVDLGGDSAESVMNKGRLNFLLSVVGISQEVRIDRNRVFMVAGGSAAAGASQLSAFVPHVLAGVALYGDANPDLPAENVALVPPEKVDDLAAAFAWVAQAEPRDPYPSNISAKLSEAKFGRYYWVQANKFDLPADGKTASMTVSVDKASNTITIEAEMVYQIELFLNDQIIDLSKPIRINRNGQTIEVTATPGFTTLLQNYKAFLRDTGAIYPVRLRAIDVPEKADE